MTVENKHILFIAHRIPYPPNKGDKIRTFNEIKYLSRFFTIDLLTMADEKSDLRFKPNLEMYCNFVHIFPLNRVYGKLKGLKSLLAGKSISEGYFYKSDLYHKLSELLSQNDYHAIFCFSSPMAAYIFKFFGHEAKFGKKIKLVMDFCDVDSEKWRQYANNSTFPLSWLYKIEAKRLAVFERKTNRYFDVSIFVSEEESHLFTQMVPDAKQVKTIANGIDHTYFSPESISPESESTSQIIMFAGAMDYYANVEGVEWFCKEIFPMIRDKIPGVLFYIVGNNPHPRVRALGNIKNVIVTGFVDDMRPYYQQADLCVVPLRVARGIQNKVLEAMSMEKSVVSTSDALCGIHASHGDHLFQADTPKMMAHYILMLLGDKKLSRETGRAARKFVKKNFSWERSMEKLVAVLNNAL